MNVDGVVEKSSQLSKEYLSLVGACTYVFLRAEWMAVYCCEVMENGYLAKVTDAKSRIMAGKISCKLLELTSCLDDSSGKATLLARAGKFQKLVKDRRNVLLHAYPASIDGMSTLHNPKDQHTFTSEDLEEFLGEAYTVADDLNDSYYKFLKDKN